MFHRFEETEMKGVFLTLFSIYLYFQFMNPNHGYLNNSSLSVGLLKIDGMQTLEELYYVLFMTEIAPKEH